MKKPRREYAVKGRELYAWAADAVARRGYSNFGWWQLADELQHRTEAVWVKAGGTRVAVALDDTHVLKMGHPEDMRQEQTLWLDATARGRRWLLPLLAHSPGEWSILPLVPPIPASLLCHSRTGRDADGNPPVVVDPALQRAALAALGGDEHISTLDWDDPANWGWFGGAPVLLDYAAPIHRWSGR